MIDRFELKTLEFELGFDAGKIFQNKFLTYWLIYLAVGELKLLKLSLFKFSLSFSEITRSFKSILTERLIH